MTGSARRAHAQKRPNSLPAGPFPFDVPDFIHRSRDTSTFLPWLPPPPSRHSRLYAGPSTARFVRFFPTTSFYFVFLRFEIRIHPSFSQAIVVPRAVPGPSRGKWPLFHAQFLRVKICRFFFHVFLLYAPARRRTSRGRSTFVQHGETALLHDPLPTPKQLANPSDSLVFRSVLSFSYF